MSEDPTPPDVPADTPDEVESRRPVQMVALDPRFLRRSVLIILVGILLFQILEWSALRLAGFLFNLLLAWLLAISFDPWFRASRSGECREPWPRPSWSSV